MLTRFLTFATPSHRAAAVGLEESAESQGISVECRPWHGAEGVGWFSAVRSKPQFLLSAFAGTNARGFDALCWLDADCLILRPPALLTDDALLAYDAAVPRRPGGEWDSGVVWVNASQGGWDFIDAWLAAVEAHPGQPDGDLIGEACNSPGFRVRALPPEYNWIPTMSDREHPAPKGGPVILHHAGTLRP